MVTFGAVVGGVRQLTAVEWSVGCVGNFITFIVVGCGNHETQVRNYFRPGRRIVPTLLWTVVGIARLRCLSRPGASSLSAALSGGHNNCSSIAAF